MFGLTAHWAQLLSSRGAKYGLVFLYRVIEAVCVINSIYLYAYKYIIFNTVVYMLKNLKLKALYYFEY